MAALYGGCVFDSIDLKRIFSSFLIFLMFLMGKTEDLSHQSIEQTWLKQRQIKIYKRNL
jgi:hypothetical protein